MRRVDQSRVEPNRFARALFSSLPERYDLLSEVLSFGQNRRWRRELIARVAEGNPKTALDVATGTAGVALQLASRNTSVVGIDLTPEMIRHGRSNAIREGQRIAFVVGAAEQLPFVDESFDACTFTYLLRYVSDPAATIRELVRVVKPGGVIASLEFFAPTFPIFRLGWFAYTRSLLPLIGGLVGGRRWFDVGRFLGPSISEHYRSYPLHWHLRAWADAGVSAVGFKKLSLGAGLVMWGRKSHE